jgi:hypothetical protein
LRRIGDILPELDRPLPRGGRFRAPLAAEAGATEVEWVNQALHEHDRAIDDLLGEVSYAEHRPVVYVPGHGETHTVGARTYQAEVRHDPLHFAEGARGVLARLLHEDEVLVHDLVRDALFAPLPGRVEAGHQPLDYGLVRTAGEALGRQGRERLLVNRADLTRLLAQAEPMHVHALYPSRHPAHWAGVPGGVDGLFYGVEIASRSYIPEGYALAYAPGDPPLARAGAVPGAVVWSERDMVSGERTTLRRTIGLGAIPHRSAAFRYDGEYVYERVREEPPVAPGFYRRPPAYQDHVGRFDAHYGEWGPLGFNEINYPLQNVFEAAGGVSPGSATKAAASDRALGLLLTYVSPEERSELERTGLLPCTGASGYRYRLRLQYEQNVLVFDPSGSNCLGKLCAYPRIDVPVYDSVLTQYLHLKFDEEAYWGKANYFASRYDYPIPFKPGGGDRHAYGAGERGERIELVEGRGGVVRPVGYVVNNDRIFLRPDERLGAREWGLGAVNRPVGFANITVVNDVMGL